MKAIGYGTSAYLCDQTEIEGCVLQGNISLHYDGGVVLLFKPPPNVLGDPRLLLWLIVQEGYPDEEPCVWHCKDVEQFLNVYWNKMYEMGWMSDDAAEEWGRKKEALRKEQAWIRVRAAERILGVKFKEVEDGDE